MEHELAITDYSLAFHKGASAESPILFWERTSPISKDIARAYKVAKPNPRDPERNAITQTVHFNPDTVDCVAGEETEGKTTLYLACGELDRDTENLETEFLPKIYAYDEFIKARHITDLLSY
jgi:hypothetical protein